MKISAGRTSPGDWVQHPTNKKQIYVDVDTSAADFKTTPVYVCSLAGNSKHWATTGGSCPYVPGPKGFRVHVRYAAIPPGVIYLDITPAEAENLGWHVTWVGVET